MAIESWTLAAIVLAYGIHADTGKPFAEVTHGDEAKETAAA